MIMTTSCREVFLATCSLRQFHKLIHNFDSMMNSLAWFEGNISVQNATLHLLNLGKSPYDTAALARRKAVLVDVDIALMSAWVTMRTSILESDFVEKYEIVQSIDNFYRAPYCAVTTTEWLQEKEWRLSRFHLKQVPESHPYQFKPAPGGWSAF